MQKRNGNNVQDLLVQQMLATSLEVFELMIAVELHGNLFRLWLDMLAMPESFPDAQSAKENRGLLPLLCHVQTLKQVSLCTLYQIKLTSRWN